MAKITFRKVNENSCVNNTWLQCYCGYIVKLVETEHSLKNHGTLPSLEGALTHEAPPIAYGVGG